MTDYTTWPTPAQATRLLGKCLDSVYALIENGTLEAINTAATGIGKRARYRINPQSIDDFAKSRRVQPKRIDDRKSKSSLLPKGVRCWV